MRRALLLVGVCVLFTAALASVASGGPADALRPSSLQKAKPVCLGKRATIVGTAKSNVLTGTRRNDVIVGLGGNDTINGLAGNDLVCGGGGTDKLEGGGEPMASTVERESISAGPVSAF